MMDFGYSKTKRFYLAAVTVFGFVDRVFSAYIKEIDEKPEATPWGKKMSFTTLMAEFSNGGGEPSFHEHSFLPAWLF